METPDCIGKYAGYRKLQGSCSGLETGLWILRFRTRGGSEKKRNLVGSPMDPSEASYQMAPSFDAY